VHPTGTELYRRLYAALVALRARGHTASLQSTPMARRLYAALGFRDLGGFLEYVPPSSRL
jgi:hypothetical protein